MSTWRHAKLRPKHWPKALCACGQLAHEDGWKDYHKATYVNVGRKKFRTMHMHHQCIAGEDKPTDPVMRALGVPAGKYHAHKRRKE